MSLLTNRSPYVSDVARGGLMTNEQKLGNMWRIAQGQSRGPATERDLPALTAAGGEAFDTITGWAGSSTPIRAYHGSPHTFDRFDMSKLGTGEGAQAYGHGLYFAGNEGVAKSYRDTLTRETGNTMVWRDAAGKTYDLDKLRFLAESGDPKGFAATFLNQAGSVDDAISYVTKYGAGAFPGGKPQYEGTLNALRDMKGAGLAKVPGGSMYEVNLRTSPERLLDWDKPLSQQPAVVQDFARSADLSHLKPGNRTRRMIEMWREGTEQPHNPATGHTFHNAVSDYGGQSNPALSEALRKAGLDGIQYLDGGSRAAGEGSRNYVMFDDKLIEILRRYGLAGMLGGGAGAGLLSQEAQQ